MKTLRELANSLAKQDEVTVLEILDLTSEQIVERFFDVVEEREEYIRKELDEDEEFDLDLFNDDLE